MTRIVIFGVAITAVATPGVKRAARIYAEICGVCHGSDGAGALPGVPDFTTADGPLRKPDAELVRSTINGTQGNGASAAMPPKGGNPLLTDEDIATVVRYIRKYFGARPGRTIRPSPPTGAM